MVNWLHHGDALRTLDILSRILTSGYKDGRHNITGMSAESSKSPSYGRAGKVLEHVELHQRGNVGLQYIPHQFPLYDCLAHNRLPTPFYPVNRRSLLVGTEVSCTNMQTISGTRQLIFKKRAGRGRNYWLIPEILMTSMSGKSSWRNWRTFLTPWDTMFMPIASPVLQLNLMYTFFPAIAQFILCNIVYLLDLHSPTCFC